VIHSLDQLVEENSQAFLRCSVPGHPEAQLSWRLENGVDARRLPGIVDDGRGTLRIEPVAEEHQRHGFVCWAVYPRRADKQALHAGPARIRLVKKEEEEPAAGTGDGEVHPTAEEEEEAGEGKEAEAEEKPDDQKQQQQQQVDDQASGTPAEKEEPNQVRNEKQQQPADPFGAEEEEDGQMLNKAEEMPQIPVENDQPTETDNAGQGQQTEAEEGSGEAMIQIEPLLNAVKAIAMESGEQQQQNGNGQQTEEEEGREDKSNGIRREKRNV